MALIYRRVHVLKIKGIIKNRKMTLNSEQIYDILNYNPKAHIEKMKKDNHPRKLAIIEFYLKRGSGRKVSDMLHISRHFVNAAIREYNETGTITVSSRLNNEEYEMENVNLV